jgi:hypothetical protein
MSYLYYKKFVEKIQGLVQQTTRSYVFLASGRKSSSAWTWLQTDNQGAKQRFVVHEEMTHIDKMMVYDGIVFIVDDTGAIKWDAVETELHRFGEELDEFDEGSIPDIIDELKRWVGKNPPPIFTDRKRS